MSLTRRTLIVCAALMLAGVGRAAGTNVVIDDFSSASTTLFATNTNVAQTTVGSTTVADPGLSGVIGGVRTLTVAATALALPGNDTVVAGVDPLIVSLEYTSTVGADGVVELLYDAGGAGLNADFQSDFAIRVLIRNADLAAPPYVVTVTLTDNLSNSAPSAQPVLTPGGPFYVTFPLSEFSGIDLTKLFSIKVAIDPSIAGDMRIGTIEVIQPAPSPTLSPAMTLALVVALSAVGLHGLVRSRFGK